jgi:hypothetical protein
LPLGALATLSEFDLRDIRRVGRLDFLDSRLTDLNFRGRGPRAGANLEFGNSAATADVELRSLDALTNTDFFAAPECIHRYRSGYCPAGKQSARKGRGWLWSRNPGESRSGNLPGSAIPVNTRVYINRRPSAAIPSCPFGERPCVTRDTNFNRRPLALFGDKATRFWLSNDHILRINVLASRELLADFPGGGVPLHASFQPLILSDPNDCDIVLVEAVALARGALPQDALCSVLCRRDPNGPVAGIELQFIGLKVSKRDISTTPSTSPGLERLIAGLSTLLLELCSGQPLSAR